jgi:hypothetical protein
VADDDEEDEEGEGWFMKGGSNLWLLGVMRANLCGSSLGFFFTHLLPLCKRMAADSAAAAAKGDALKAQRCATAEYQVPVVVRGTAFVLPPEFVSRVKPRVGCTGRIDQTTKTVAENVV